MTQTNQPSLSILQSDDVDRIVGEAFQTLGQVGVFVENAEAIDLLASAGASVSDGRVFLSESLCRRCLDSAPSSFALFDRSGDKVADVGGDNVLFDPGSAAITIYDFAQGTSRKPATTDVVDFVRLSNKLDAFDAQSTGVVPSDVPEMLADRYRLFLALAYGRKPVITGTFTKEAFSTMRNMLVAIRGSESALQEKPLAIFDCCPSPPLMWSDLTAQALIDCARHKVPAETVSMPLTGATAPVTLAGSLVQHTAETISGIVIHQLAGPGSPIVYGGAPALFDMRKGTTPLGAIETMMIDAGYARIGKSFGLPVHGYMGLSDAKSPDFQAGFETAIGVTLAALSGINVVSGAGMLDFVNCQSLEKLVLDNEICAMAKRLLRGITLRDESLGLEPLRELAADKSFLTSEHTRRYFREEVYYPADVVDRATQGDWVKSGSQTAADRAHKQVAALLGAAEIDSPTQPVIDELASIMLADAKAHGADALPDWRSPLERA